MTAGRVVFDRRKSGLYLYREARDLPQIELQPGERLWDGRFRVRNTGSDRIAVHAGGETAELRARLIAAGLPEPVAKRAVKSAIGLFCNGGGIISPGCCGSFAANALRAKPYQPLRHLFAVFRPDDGQQHCRALWP
jgi:hypothetical protein